MRAWLLAALALAVVAASVAAFVAFDSRSHSASDTLRPFVLTIAPLWIVAGFLTRRLLNGRPR